VVGFCEHGNEPQLFKDYPAPWSKQVSKKEVKHTYITEVANELKSHIHPLTDHNKHHA